MERKQININLADQELAILVQIAAAAGTSVEELAAKALVDWIKREYETAQGKALLLELGKGLGDGPPDLATAHDRYLYGKEER